MRYSFKRLRNLLCLTMVASVPMPRGMRNRLTKLGGVNMKDTKHTFIGRNVGFDTLYPEQIHIGNHVHVTSGVIILTHSLDTTKNGINWKKTSVIIEDYCFIGANTIICNDVVIGRNSIVGAGSIVTKSIPPGEIWAGNPAKFLKKRI